MNATVLGKTSAHGRVLLACTQGRPAAKGFVTNPRPATPIETVKKDVFGQLLKVSQLKKLTAPVPALQQKRVQIVSLRCNDIGITYAFHIPAARALQVQDGIINHLVIGLRRYGPILVDRCPSIPKTFEIRITVLRNNRAHPIRVGQRQAETGWRRSRRNTSRDAQVPAHRQTAGRVIQYARGSHLRGAMPILGNIALALGLICGCR